MNFRPKSKRWRELIHFAYEQAATSNVVRGKHCAIVLDPDFNIVSMNVNTRCTHAEAGAVRKLSPAVRPERCFVLVVRNTLEGKMTMSKPCDNCASAMRSSGIHTCVYSCGENKFEKQYL